MNEIEALKRRHMELEEALTAVESHVSLTAKEQTERARLKKEKLAIKDRIQVLLAQQSQFPWGVNT